MDDLNNFAKEYKLSFQGKGSDYFKVVIVNWLLTIITLGFYYPWAKAKQLAFLYNSTSFENDSFVFHGTGNEMFKGFLKVILLIASAIAVFGILLFLKVPLIGFLVFQLSLIAITPLAIHGSYRYRMSRTSWRGIRFGYRGNRKELFILFFKSLFLIIITFGIYSPWFEIKLRNYILNHIRFGDAEFNSDAVGTDYFLLMLKGYFLTIVTLGIYMFWWQKELFEYFVNHTSIHKDDKCIEMTSIATGGGFFKLMIVNLLIMVFTLGFGYAWVVTRTMNFVFENIKLEGDIEVDSLLQTEDNYTDAMGEDLNDFLNIDLII